METIRIGVIGAGIMGNRHIEQYKQIEGAEVVAVVDIVEEKAKRAAERHGVPHYYTDFRRMLERDDIDAVDVCLHNNLHAPVTIAALESGRHVYGEKPIAGSYADGLAMVEAAKRCGKMLHIQLSTLYTKETKAAKAIIDGGALGNIYHARSMGFRRRGRPYVDGYATPEFVQKEVAGGGALFDMAVYHIAQILYLIGMPGVERVTGKVYQETPMDEERRRISGYNVEEFAAGFVHLAGGITLDIAESWALHLDGFEGSSIVGSLGGLRLSPFSFHTIRWDLEMDATFNLDAMEYRRNQLDPDPARYRSSQHHWIAALQGRVELLPTADIALQTMLIQEGIYLADRLGREVTAEEIVKMSKSTQLPV
ncbi:MAG: Gfo/Idh/MocA family oxidoreductase [Firmicutes bacterium]|nr:Gfo/Idh/MocA family oxidoreductase [Bacillota bacterium]